MTEIQLGVYRHFRGGQYRVIGIATHTESKDQYVVYYDEDGRLWARPPGMFQEYVPVDGQWVRRFEYTEGRSFSDAPLLDSDSE